MTISYYKVANISCSNNNSCFCFYCCNRQSCCWSIPPDKLIFIPLIQIEFRFFVFYVFVFLCFHFSFLEHWRVQPNTRCHPFLCIKTSFSGQSIPRFHLPSSDRKMSPLFDRSRPHIPSDLSDIKGNVLHQHFFFL